MNSAEFDHLNSVTFTTLTTLTTSGVCSACNVEACKCLLKFHVAAGKVLRCPHQVDHIAQS